MLISISADSLLHCFPICEKTLWKLCQTITDPHQRALHRTKIHGPPPLTEGFCLMQLLGPGKPKIAFAKFLAIELSKKINSTWNRIRQILVMVLKNCSNEIRTNEIRIGREPSVYKLIGQVTRPLICCDFGITRDPHLVWKSTIRVFFIRASLLLITAK